MKLYVREAGSGEALVLLHGNGENSSYFEYQIPYFSQHYHVIAVDTRGHGKSPRGTKPFTLIQFAKDLKQLQEIYQIKSVQPFDMFSQTQHVETVCLLSRNK